MTATRRIQPEEIEEILGQPLNDHFRNRCLVGPFEYHTITQEERDAYLLDVVQTLMKTSIVAAGEHRLEEWEDGWSENLRLLNLENAQNALVPKYYGKHPLSRWRRQIIRPVSSAFDYAILAFMVNWALETYASDAGCLFEFGCGPAYHLLRSRRINPAAHLVGLDWATASQKIIAKIKEAKIETNLEGRRFNFFEPDDSLDLPGTSAVYTVAALEQVGDQYEPFLQYLLRKRPAICIHFEPLEELLDERSLIDALSILYFRKRNYLRGFLTRLRQLEAEGTISILRQQRIFSGSYYIEGHSLVVWKPL